MLSCANKVIGITAHSGNPVLFRGVLKIRSLKWLSKRGHELVERALRRRDIHERRKDGVVHDSALSLDALYNPTGVLRGEKRFRVKVLLQGEKNMPVSSMASRKLPEGLLFQSKDAHRQFEITSVDATVAELSQTFFSRSRTIALLRHIVDRDKHAPEVALRTPEYFIDRFLQHHVSQPHSLHTRILFDSNDSDVDFDGTTRTPRLKPHTSRAEAYHIFARDAEWVLADQLAIPREESRVLDVHAWKLFCHEVRRGRSRAVREGRVWGRRADEDPEESDVSDGALLDGIRITGREIEKLKEAARKTGKRKKGKGKKKPPPPPPEVLSDDAMSTTEDNAPIQNIYDSDFSEDSTISYVSSRSVSPVPPIDPELHALIPDLIFRKPKLPGPDMTWWCPIYACLHSIDFAKLSDADARALGPDDAARIRARKYVGIAEEWVRVAFGTMVQRHYFEDHLGAAGVRAVNKGRNGVAFEWIRPELHRPWPPPRQLRPDEEEAARIKMEEREEGFGIPPPPRRLSTRIRAQPR
ncbi:hypothetical protein PLICRDRAFT_700486 [Plicaturopsis crispa FD-325 SS-3]|nr:hypothetical protein PLICRDRAFT_700486 [Plicaturopsis crispa FD-325 SS-3]